MHNHHDRTGPPGPPVRRWPSSRVIPLLLALLLALAPVPALAQDAETSTAVDLDQMDAAHEGEVAALEAEHVALAAAAEAASASRRDGAEADTAARVAELRAQADREGQARGAALDAARTAREEAWRERVAAVDDDAASRSADVTVLIEQLAAGWAEGADDATTAWALELALQARVDELEVLQQRWEARRDQVDAAAATTAADLAAQRADTVQAAEDELAGLAEAAASHTDALTAELEALESGESAARQALLADHAEDLRVVTAVQDAQVAAALAAGADTTSLQEHHERVLHDLADQHSAELAAHDDAQEARIHVLRQQLTAAVEDHEAAVAAVEDTLARHLSVLDELAEQAEKRRHERQTRDREDHEERVKWATEHHDHLAEDLDKGEDKLAERLQKRLEKIEQERGIQLHAAQEDLDKDLERLEKAAEEADTAAAETLEDAVKAAEDHLELLRHAEDARLHDELAAIDRDVARRLALLESEYYNLRKRAVAFIAHGQFGSLDATYDPETDDGSLYNVVRRINAHDVDATGAGIDVAVIDTGITDVPGLAEADVVIGPDFSFDDVHEDLRARDAHGHGTHMSSIIAGRDQAWVDGDHERRPDRFLGVAPDARVVSVKAGAADGGVDVTQVIAALNWVIDNRTADDLDIRVVNLSFGTDAVQDWQLDPLSHAVERAWHAGIVVVVAAGNDGWAAERLTNPASNPWVIAVGAAQAASKDENIPSGFSNGSLGGRTVDIAAPGRSIVGLRVPGSLADENAPALEQERFIRGSGTSQAAAVVSGAVALILSERPELTPDQVKQLLTETADDHGDPDPALVGAGYVDVKKALEATPHWRLQPWPRSTGEGTMDGARGTVRVVLDGVALEGEMDIFGNDWSGWRWSEDSWTGSRWSGSRWSGSRWSGSRWSSEVWSGQAWSGSRWSSEEWLGSRWSGSRWSGSQWSGSRWSGSRWSAGGWFGAGWSGWDARAAVDAE